MRLRPRLVDTIAAQSLAGWGRVFGFSVALPGIAWLLPEIILVGQIVAFVAVALIGTLPLSLAWDSIACLPGATRRTGMTLLAAAVWMAAVSTATFYALFVRGGRLLEVCR